MKNSESKNDLKSKEYNEINNYKKFTNNLLKERLIGRQLVWDSEDKIWEIKSWQLRSFIKISEKWVPSTEFKICVLKIAINYSIDDLSLLSDIVNILKSWVIENVYFALE